MAATAGDRYERLTVLESEGRKLLVRCDCGTVKTILAVNWRRKTRSCGCLHRELLRQPRKHGLTASREYRSWGQMKVRCLNPRSKIYKYYGGRGILICQRWLDSFVLFLQDMGPRPSGTSLDRIDGDGNYEPGNCRWATARQQAANRHRRGYLSDSSRPPEQIA